jgi:hypothetical protein
MQKSKKVLGSEVAKIIADKAEKALAVQDDLEWWSVLLESFYGSSPPKADRKQRY